MNAAQQLESWRQWIALGRGRVRARALALRGARVGAKVTIGANCTVTRPWCVEIGDRVLLESDAYLKVVDDDGRLTLSDHVFVGRGVEFDVMARISVGAHSLIAPRCFITDHNHGIAPQLRIDQQPCAVARVVIGQDVWLGTGVVVLPGVTIGDGAVVGANSVVNADVAAMTIVAGVPARFVRLRASGSRRASVCEVGDAQRSRA